jgi:MraZ protein
VLVGRTQRLEIWSEDLWESEVKQSRETYIDILSEKQPMSDALKSLSW